MPRHQNIRRQQPVAPLSEWGVATSNSTANAFLGGRRPSWVTGTVKPTPRPQNVSSTAQQAQIAPAPVSAPASAPALAATPVVSTTVLPSPAPSDEPSPPMSNPHGSPDMASAALPGPLNAKQREVATRPNLPAAQATFSPQLAAAGGRGSDRAGATGFLSRSPPLQTVTGPPLAVTAAAGAGEGAHVAAVLGTERNPSPSRVSTSPTADAQDTAISAPPQATAQNTVREVVEVVDAPRTASAGGHGDPQRKRKRPDYGSSHNSPSIAHRRNPSAHQFQPYGSILAAHLSRIGEDTLTDVERPRFRLLQDACARDDRFFLAVHQLLCVWTLNPSEAHRAIGAAPVEADAAFHVMEQVLRRNTELRPSNIDWFARFPGPLELMVRQPGVFLELMPQVSDFLVRLSRGWDSLLTLAFARRYPFLMDELVGLLGCMSPTLQLIFFTACRRRLGMVDGKVGYEFERVFKEDQRAHKVALQSHSAVAPTSVTDLEQRNARTIHLYRMVVRMSDAGLLGASPLQKVPSSPAPTATEFRAQQNFTNARFIEAHQGMQQQAAMDQARRSSAAGLGIQQAPSPTGLTMFTPHGQQHSPLLPQSPAFMSIPPSMPSPSAVPPHLVIPSQGQQAGAMVSPNPYTQLAQAQDLLQYQVQRLTQLQVAQSQQHQTQLHQAQLHHQAQLQRRARQLHMEGVLTPPPTGYFPPTTSSAPAPPRLVQSPITPQGPVSLGGVTNGSLHHNQASRFVDQAMLNLSLPQQRQQQTAASVAPPPNVHNMMQPQHARNRELIPRRLLPPKGAIISRGEWAYDTTDRKSLAMSLHQVNLRSPQRVVQELAAHGADSEPQSRERFYQAVKAMAVGPTPTPPQPYLYTFEFGVSEADFALLPKQRVPPEELLPLCEHFQGSLRYRLRCCSLRAGAESVTEAEWVTKDTTWPMNIFIKFNDQTVTARRQPQNGKDLPVELTQLIRVGKNTLQVAIPQAVLGKDARSNSCFIGVDIVETMCHSNVLNLVWKSGLMDADVTLNTIKSRLSGNGDDDDFAFVQKDLPIDLADPFSAKIFEIPVRGAGCTHLECFDLDNWLSTRPTKVPPPCKHRAECQCNKTPEPSNPDKWRCPICSGDARPYSLRIDGFLLAVRRQLERDRKLAAKSLLVAPDGTWQPVLPDDDDSDYDAGSDGDAVSGGRTSARGSRRPSKRLTREPSASTGGGLPGRRGQTVEVIELDDDD